MSTIVVWIVLWVLLGVFVGRAIWGVGAIADPGDPQRRRPEPDGRRVRPPPLGPPDRRRAGRCGRRAWAAPRTRPGPRRKA